MTTQDTLPSVEKSLKYMAWNMKEMSENIAKLTNYFLGLPETRTEHRLEGQLQPQEQTVPF